MGANTLQGTKASNVRAIPRVGASGLVHWNEEGVFGTLTPWWWDNASQIITINESSRGTIRWKYTPKNEDEILFLRIWFWSFGHTPGKEHQMSGVITDPSGARIVSSFPAKHYASDCELNLPNDGAFDFVLTGANIRFGLYSYIQGLDTPPEGGGVFTYSPPAGYGTPADDGLWRPTDANSAERGSLSEVVFTQDLIAVQ